MSITLPRIFAVLLFCVFAHAGLAQEQTPTQERPPAPPQAAQGAPPEAVEAPTVAQVQARIAEVKANEALSDEEEQSLLTPLETALAALQQRNAAQTQRQEFIDATTSVPGTLQQLRTELDQPVVPRSSRITLNSPPTRRSTPSARYSPRPRHARKPPAMTSPSSRTMRKRAR